MPNQRRPRALAASRWVGGDDYFAPTRAELEKVGVDLVITRAESLDDILAEAREVDAIYQGVTALTRDVLTQLPNLKAACALGIGFDDFDVDAATELGIVVINLPRVFHREVAAHTWALLLSLVRQIVPLNAALHDRPTHPDASLHPATPHHHLYGETLGLIAFGNIARVVATIAKPFEMKVIAFDPFVAKEVADEYGVSLVSLEELLRESDFVSVHTPLSKGTFHLLGEEQFRSMKPTALFINTSRGRVVDEVALTRALREGWIAGAGLDVTEIEPPEPNNPLLTLPNVILTPHIASASDKARIERARWMGIEVGRVLNGQWPINGLVNRGVTPRQSLS